MFKKHFARSRRRHAADTGLKLGSCILCSVIPEIEIWRAAQLIVKRYDNQAEAESTVRAGELEAVGDREGTAAWRRIALAVIELANKTPPGRLLCM